MLYTFKNVEYLPEHNLTNCLFALGNTSMNKKYMQNRKMEKIKQITGIFKNHILAYLQIIPGKT